jgi:hypothetical protein
MAQGDLLLSARRIDLWFVFSAAIDDGPLLRCYRGLLSEDEWQQERRFQHGRDRVRYLATRALVRTVLSRYVPMRPQDWCLGTNAYGKPAIVDGPVQASDISFNLSHTDSAIVLAVTRRSPLGIDIENVRGREVPLDVADSFLAPDGMAAWDGASFLADPDTLQSSWRFWQLSPAPDYLVSLRAGRLHGGAMQTLVARQTVPLVTESPLDYVLTRYSD